MQFKTLLVSALVGVVAAQDIGTLVCEIPSCALTCLLTAGTSAGCDATDYKCQCSNASKIQSSAAPSLEKACTAQEISSMLLSMSRCL